MKIHSIAAASAALLALLALRATTAAASTPASHPTAQQWLPYIGPPKIEWLDKVSPTEFVNHDDANWNIAFGANNPLSRTSVTFGFTSRRDDLFYEHTLNLSYWVTAATLSENGDVALIAGKRRNGNTCIDRLVFSMPGEVALPQTGYSPGRFGKIVVLERDGLGPPASFVLAVENIYDLSLIHI